MVAAVRQLLGVGLYTAHEAARYARISPRLMNSWLDRASDAVVHRSVTTNTTDNDRYVTFLGFVEALAIHDIRRDHKISLTKILEAESRACDQYGIENPLARKHATYLFNNQIYIQLPGQDDVTGMTGNAANQIAMKQVVEVCAIDLTFNDEGLASLYRAFSWKDIEIKMDPRVRFGEPIIESCQYSVQALIDACHSEGGIREAADAYGVRPAVVEAAFRYYDHLQGESAA